MLQSEITLRLERFRRPGRRRPHQTWRRPHHFSPSHVRLAGTRLPTLIMRLPAAIHEAALGR